MRRSPARPRICRLLLGALVTGLLLGGVARAAGPYPDVPAWVETAVSWADANDYLTGYPDGTFRPDDPITRAQYARFVYRAEGSPPVAGLDDHGFSDVPPWVDHAVTWLADQDLVDGYPDGTFRPDETILRGSATRLIHRLAGEPAGTMAHGLSDVPPWLEAAVTWVTDDPAGPSKPLMTGYPDGTFRPRSTISRAEATRLLHRYEVGDTTWSAETDPTQIPLGDGNLSTAPEIDSILSCVTNFNGPGGFDGPWIDQAGGTWDSTTKLSVLGSNTWPQAAYSESLDADERVIQFSDLPVDHVTGDFPIAVSDPAYQYDRNPNSIEPKSIELRIPVEPTAAASPRCLGLGPIGVLKNGVFLYNGLDAAGFDAAAHEIQDVCDGHPDNAHAYHHHHLPSCLLEATPSTGSTLIGYALDGYGIYVERDSAGNLPTNADLDACHGSTSAVPWNGTEQSVYHYSATLEYPYTVGCYHGTPVPTPSRR